MFKGLSTLKHEFLTNSVFEGAKDLPTLKRGKEILTLKRDNFKHSYLKDLSMINPDLPTFNNKRVF